MSISNNTSLKTPRNKKVVLVTGATGFIGRQAIRPLVMKGYQVHILTSKKEAPTKAIVENYFNLSDEQISKVSFHFCDLLDFKSLDVQLTSILKVVKPSHLLHLAWYVKHGEFWNSSLNLDWVSASLKLAELFEKHGGARMVMAGTCAEYDWSQISTYIDPSTKLPKGLAEDFPVGPNTLYGECKLSQYKILQKFSQNTQLELVWGRIFLTYGPHEGVSRLIPYIIQTLLKNEISQLKVNWHQVRDFLHVKDLAAGFVHLVDDDGVGIFNIASGKPVTLGHIFLQILKQMKAFMIDTDSAKDISRRIGAYIGNDTSAYKNFEEATSKLIAEIQAFSAASSAATTDVLFADVKKITDTGWSLEISLEQGLTETIHYWKERLIEQ